jgi:UDP-2,4-diacetamido-2,4,6-trideoxy-beta-L-altropyranose hydrolase
MIGIRADANETIATGHIMRCVAIAKELERLGEEVLFLTADEFANKLLAQRGCKSLSLHSNWKEKEQELPMLLETLKAYQIDKLLVDSYEVTPAYLETLRQQTKLIYIDDLYGFSYSVDMLINYSICVKEEKYASMQERVRMLLGSEYTPLRDEFSGKSIEIKDEVSKVFMTTGGSDNLFMIQQLLEVLKKQKKYQAFELYVVVGSFFKNTDTLIALKKEFPNIILHHGVTNMAELMMECDVAISAGGTTLAELSALGLPTICFAVADNQLEGMKAYAEKAKLLSVGDVRNQVEESVLEIWKHFDSLVESKVKRMEMSHCQRACVDGMGARRIAKELKNL